jgi:hypothetical protein
LGCNYEAEAVQALQPCTVEATHKANWPAGKRSTEAEQAALERATIQDCALDVDDFRHFWRLTGLLPKEALRCGQCRCAL